MGAHLETGIFGQKPPRRPKHQRNHTQQLAPEFVTASMAQSFNNFEDKTGLAMDEISIPTIPKNLNNSSFNIKDGAPAHTLKSFTLNTSHREMISHTGMANMPGDSPLNSDFSLVSKKLAEQVK